MCGVPDTDCWSRIGTGNLRGCADVASEISHRLAYRHEGSSVIQKLFNFQDIESVQKTKKSSPSDRRNRHWKAWQVYTPCGIMRPQKVAFSLSHSDVTASVWLWDKLRRQSQFILWGCFFAPCNTFIIIAYFSRFVKGRDKNTFCNISQSFDVQFSHIANARCWPSQYFGSWIVLYVAQCF